MTDSFVLFLNDPLDLLHRFTPTPFQRTIRMDSTRIQVKSNDALLLPPGALHAPAPGIGAERFASWKLIRDPKSPGNLEPPMQLSVFGNVTAVFMGSACLIAVDPEESELVAFIGTQVDAGQFRDLVLPVLCRLSEVGCGATASTACPAAY